MNHTSRPFALHTLSRSVLAISAALCITQTTLAQHWDRVVIPAPGDINLMLLLSDGTVMASANDGAEPIGNAWFRLTPDIHGSYVDGTWSTLAPMLDTRLHFQSQVLRDGRIFVSGGEFGTGASKAEIYDPAANTWTALSIPPALWTPGVNSFSDCNSTLLPDGSVMLMPRNPHQPGVALRYDPSTNTWSNAGALFRGTAQNGATWLKLPDDSILTIDPASTLSERYIPSTNTWVNDGVVPVSLYDSFGFNIGGAVLLPNGNAFFLGATGHTAIYTPSGTTAPGTWTAGADLPGGMGTPDAPCAMLVNGKVLCVASDTPTAIDHFPERVSYFEYDYITNTFAQISNASGGSTNIPTNIAAMLALPDGSVILSRMFPNTSVWIPLGDPAPTWKPTINTVIKNPDGTYHLTGTQLNGISEGASYGDDLQMSTNYPIVRLTGTTGNIYYARTFNWSSTGVQTGSQIVSTEFSLPAALPVDTYTLVVSASGISSDPFPLPTCTADFNNDSIVDFFDYLDFVDAFSSNSASADFNNDSIIDFFDYLDFVDAFSTGC